MPVEVVLLAPENETAVAYRLADDIRRSWPDLGPDDEVRILVGLQMVREIDLAVVFNLAHPRAVAPVRRRDGTLSPEQWVQSGLLLIEVKQKDAGDLVAAGADVFVNWGASKQSSLSKQLKDQVDAFDRWRSRYGLPFFWIHGIAWLTSVSEDLRFADVAPQILTKDATWFQMLDAAGQREYSLFGVKDAAFRSAIDRIGVILSRPHALTQRDRRRLDALTDSRLTDTVIEQAKSALGKKQLRLCGRAGSGKSTALAMLCRYAYERGERVLLLAYHLALCNELEQLVRSIAGGQALKEGYISVQPIADFLADAYGWMFAPIPSENGKRDYGALDRALEAVTENDDACDRLATSAAELKEQYPERFAYDYIFIDEAQDCRDAEREFLRCCYATEAFVLADGVDQLVRRFERCNWNVGVSAAEREYIELPQSLRMSKNVAQFVNEVAIAAGARSWRIAPHPQLLGGRIVVYSGDACADKAFFEELLADVRAEHAAPEDLLIAVWHELVDKTTRESRIARALRSWGYEVWDGVTSAARAVPPASSECIRVVQYDSVRGLEGWCTVLMELDAFFDFRKSLPNADGCVTEADRTEAARRAVLMALTRAAHTLVVTLRNPESEAARWILEAVAKMPREVVRHASGTARV